jgi:hypothetical protein
MERRLRGAEWWANGCSIFVVPRGVHGARVAANIAPAPMIGEKMNAAGSKYMSDGVFKPGPEIPSIDW